MAKKDNRKLSVKADNKDLYLKVVLTVIGILILMALAFLLGKAAGDKEVVEVIPIDEDRIVEINQSLEDDEEEGMDEEEEEDAELTFVDAGGDLDINWIPVASQQTIDHLEVFGPQGEGYGDEFYSMFSQYEVVAYELGSVDGGIYDDYQLTLQILQNEGLGTYYTYLYILVPDSDREPAVILDRYGGTIGGFSQIARYRSASEWWSDEQVTALSEATVFDTGAGIEELGISRSAFDTLGRGYEVLGVGHSVDHNDDIEFTSLPYVGVVDGFTLRASGRLFVTQREDGRIVYYDILIPFWDHEVSEDGFIEMIQVPEILWHGGVENTHGYVKGVTGGCGSSPHSNVVDIDEVGAILAAGTYDDEGVQREVYEPVDYSSDYFASGLASYIRMNDLDGLEEEEAFEIFVAVHPYFYYEDDHGRWIQFQHEDVAPLGECGKPVIYLYPEETTDMTVEVAPQGGFTITEPDYNDGWNVTAHPDGRILNHGDKTHYPYLFWEGHGNAVPFPPKFWVVEKTEVQSFLEDTLKELGLNRAESSDFLEFWLPKMQESPFYKIGFHGNEVMDYLAPLTISERPDTVIRILMDYEELQAPVEENPPQLRAIPKREGFTVIEWGGVLK